MHRPTCSSNSSVRRRAEKIGREDTTLRSAGGRRRSVFLPVGEASVVWRGRWSSWGQRKDSGDEENRQAASPGESKEFLHKGYRAHTEEAKNQRRSRMISRAALAPDAPVKPLPGCVPEPQRYSPQMGVL